jgi:hypothetical protein
MGDTLLPDDDDEPNHWLFPFSSRSQFFMNSPDVIRDITLSLKIVLHGILENFTVISPRKKYPAAFTIDEHPKGGRVLP